MLKSKPADHGDPSEMLIHRKIIEDMWDYRYWRLIQNAVRLKDWIPVFAFIG
jgi:hypothetical protein